MYKILHNECVTKKSLNVDLTALSDFLYAPKLPFGNLILNEYVFTYIDKIKYM